MLVLVVLFEILPRVGIDGSESRRDMKRFRAPNIFAILGAIGSGAVRWRFRGVVSKLCWELLVFSSTSICNNEVWLERRGCRTKL